MKTLITLTQTICDRKRSYSEEVEMVSNLQTLIHRLYHDHLLSCGSKRRSLQPLRDNADGTIAATFGGYVRSSFGGGHGEWMPDPVVTVTLQPVAAEEVPA